jgi:hypothetical protein
VSANGKCGGLLLRVRGELRFVPATVALRVAPPPRVTPVPGAPPELAGIALHEGAIVAVVAVGSEVGEMIVCQHAGELLGVVGCEIVQTGLFDAAADRPGMVEHEGETVQPLELAAIYGRIQASARPGRWGA